MTEQKETNPRIIEDWRPISPRVQVLEHWLPLSPRVHLAVPPPTIEEAEPEPCEEEKG